MKQGRRLFGVARGSINFAFQSSRLSIFNFIEEWYIPSAIAFTVEPIWRSTFPSSDRHPSTVARPSTPPRGIEVLAQTRAYSAGEPCEKASVGAALAALCRLLPMRRTTV